MFLLIIQDRAECGKGTVQGGGHRTEKNLYWEGGTPHILSLLGEQMGLGGGDTAHTLLMRGTIGVGTPHDIE